MQADFVNGVFDVANRGYRVKLINGRPATLLRKNVGSKWAKQFGMCGDWGIFPDAPADILPQIERFIDEQTRLPAR